jgi:hypothetical protein
MTELEELTTGKTLPELFTLLRYQKNTGEPLSGNICAHTINEIERLGGLVITKERYSIIQRCNRGVWTNSAFPEYCGKRIAMIKDQVFIEDFDFIII